MTTPFSQCLHPATGCQWNHDIAYGKDASGCTFFQGALEDTDEDRSRSFFVVRFLLITETQILDPLDNCIFCWNRVSYWNLFCSGLESTKSVLRLLYFTMFIPRIYRESGKTFVIVNILPLRQPNFRGNECMHLYLSLIKVFSDRFIKVLNPQTAYPEICTSKTFVDKFI